MRRRPGPVPSEPFDSAPGHWGGRAVPFVVVLSHARPSLPDRLEIDMTADPSPMYGRRGTRQDHATRQHLRGAHVQDAYERLYGMVEMEEPCGIQHGERFELWRGFRYTLEQEARYIAEDLDLVPEGADVAPARLDDEDAEAARRMLDRWAVEHAALLLSYRREAPHPERGWSSIGSQVFLSAYGSGASFEDALAGVAQAAELQRAAGDALGLGHDMELTVEFSSNRLTAYIEGMVAAYRRADDAHHNTDNTNPEEGTL